MAEETNSCEVCKRPEGVCTCGQEVETPWINPVDTGVYEGDTN